MAILLVMSITLPQISCEDAMDGLDSEIDAAAAGGDDDPPPIDYGDVTDSPFWSAVELAFGSKYKFDTKGSADSGSGFFMGNRR